MQMSETSIFDVLPGVNLRVSEVPRVLSTMWTPDQVEGAVPMSDFRASQLNLILHFGLRTSPEEALATFDVAVQFAQRYPCRIIVLCPRGRELSDKLLEGKVFSQCYIGSNLRENCCCEALMLGYPTRVAGFLDNQVSIWLENDLPTYHWFHRIPAERIQETHMSFIRRCRRVIYDSSIEDDDFLSIPWEKPESVVDLAYARLLPVRQSIGQFLSSYEPKILVEDLEKVVVRHSLRRKGEGRHLLAWTQGRLEACARQAGKPMQVEFELKLNSDDAPHCLEMEWYHGSSGKHFLWERDKGKSDALLTADFGNGRETVPQKANLLEGDRALSEAIFFA